MSLKIDAKFKKISSTPESTTLQHPDGHSITVVHKALSPKMRATLASLPGEAAADKKQITATAAGKKPMRFADGGDVKKEPTFADKIAQAMGHKDAGSAPAPSPSPKPMYAEGTPDEPVKKEDNALSKLISEYDSSKQGPITISLGGARGEDQQPAAPQQPAPQPAPQQAAPMQMPQIPEKFANPNPGQQAVAKMAEASGSTPATYAEDRPYGAPEGAPQAQPKAQGSAPPPSDTLAPKAAALQDPYGTEAQAGYTSGGLGMEIAGLQNKATAETAAAAGQATAYGRGIQQQQKTLDKYQSQLSELDQHRKSLEQAIADQKIDPTKYVSSMSTGSKIMTAVGLLLGGLSSGATGKDNPALTAMNRLVDQDIEAQKAELGKKENLLSANMRQYGNLRDAMDATRLQQHDMLNATIQQAALKQGGPLAAARAQEAIGKKLQEVAPLMSNIAMRRALVAGGMDPASAIRVIVPDHQKAEATKELNEANYMLKGRASAQEIFDKATKLNTLGQRIAHPWATPEQLSALTKPLVAELSKTTAGRFTEQDAEMLDSLMPSLRDNAEGLALKRQKLADLFNKKMNFATLDAYGINPAHMPRHQQQQQPAGGFAFKPRK